MQSLWFFIIFALSFGAPAFAGEPPCAPAKTLLEALHEVREATEWVQNNNQFGPRRFRLPPDHPAAGDAIAARRAFTEAIARLNAARNAAVRYLYEHLGEPLSPEMTEEVLAASSNYLTRTGVPNRILILRDGTRTIQILPNSSLGAETSYLTHLANRLANQSIVQRGVSTHRASHGPRRQAFLLVEIENILTGGGSSYADRVVIGIADVIQRREASPILIHETRHFYENSRRITLNQGTATSPLVRLPVDSDLYQTHFIFDEAEGHLTSGSPDYNRVRRAFASGSDHVRGMPEPQRARLFYEIQGSTLHFNFGLLLIRRAREAIRPLLHAGQFTFERIDEAGLLHIRLSNGNVLTLPLDSYSHLSPPYQVTQLRDAALRLLNARDAELARLETTLDNRLAQLNRWAEVLKQAPSP